MINNPSNKQPTKLKRINGHYIFQELKEFFSASKRLVYTIKNMLIRPGKTVREFLLKDRTRCVKPITYLFVTALFFTFVQWLSGSFTSFFVVPASSVIAPFWTPIAQNMAYLSIVLSLFVAFWIKILFRKIDYNFFEIFVLLCFVLGTMLLLYLGAFIFQWKIFHFQMSVFLIGEVFFSVIALLIYPVYAIGQFFGEKRAASYLKGFLSISLGLVSLNWLLNGIFFIENTIR